ncbi:MAG TPA: 3-deoxy-7-phosphoheptulonate synthase [Flavobacteriaceae bacterium]|nr:3-deoxy-7-phosphoheptulonate synthase [Flavobacteriaceae bacterium]
MKKNWLEKMELNHPLVIAGPCSAETEDQVIEIAHELKNTKATIFRAGVWKPRTRPGNFEGIGALALPWLQRVKKETGLLIAIEVANAHHVKLALEYDVDILWIGARTTVNPFAVQEIADALKNTNKIVLVKNPINPDLELWIGAIERLQAVNIKNIGAIHRGFSTYQKTKYRNNPNWQIAIDFKDRLPNIPLINDPSHICGNRENLFDVSQMALDLQFDGLMIETHTNPDKAWSDAKQQITPIRLNELITDLIVRKAQFEEKDALKELNDLRKQINTIDSQLISLLSDRMSVSKKIGQTKKEKNVSVLQPNRWNEILEKRIKEGKLLGLNNSFMEKIYKAIHQASIKIQEEVLKK